jgi:hypothetical protein
VFGVSEFRNDETVRLIEALIEDAEFQSLNRELSETTLFDILGLSLEERIHSRMLGWLMDPAASHGLGGATLRRFLYSAAKLARSQLIDLDGNGYPMTPLQAETYSFSDLVIRAEYCLSTERRLDLLLWSERERWLCVIENKILSDEGEEQTTDYYSEMLNGFPAAKFPYRLFVYLTPEGDGPKSRHFIPMKYSALECLLSRGSDSASTFGRTAIDQYVRCLRRRVVEREQLQEVCVRLYRNHRSAIDTIVRYGNVNQLATVIAKRVLQSLRDERQPVIPDRQIEWESSSGRDWIAIWPRHWPTGPSRRYPGFYRIKFETQGTTERVQVGIWFDPPHGSIVKGLFLELSSETGPAMLEPIRSESKDLADLDREVEAGASALLGRVKDSFLPLEEALRSWNLANPDAR